MTLYLFCLATKGIFLLLVYGLRKLVQRGEIEMPSEKTLSAKKERVAQLVEMLKNSAAGVGLGYVSLGQPATTLSGGEAQRVKLAKELHRRQTGKTFYILDEPTTGLHFEDVRQLLDVLQRLVDAGNTVLVIEHNLDVIKVADRLIDMGPEGGNGGGTVVVSGTPEQVADCPQSYTGKFLAPLLRRDRERQAQLDAQ